MNGYITSDVIEAHTQCRRKAFFLLNGHPIGTEHEYIQIIRQRATDNHQRWLSGLEMSSLKLDDDYSTTIVCQNRVVESAGLRAECDALSQANNQSKPGHRPHEPHLIVGTHSITSEQKVRIAFAGFVVGESRRYRPSYGWIVPVSANRQRVTLDSMYPIIRSAVTDCHALEELVDSEPPALTLNDHCPLCPFRKHCLDEAQRSDNLTLLERLTPKMVKKYHAKGIFTITQLSHVFRPRRRRKDKPSTTVSFNVELQALALRTGKIYLNDVPSIPESSVELYFDFEGIPDEGRQYLIGLVVKKHDELTEFSFWADSQIDERLMFQNFVDVVSQYPDAPLFHYGSYEPKALRRASQMYGMDFGSLLARLENVNPHVFWKVYFPARSNSLKDLGTLIGAKWDSAVGSGIQSLACRYRWETTHDESTKKNLQAYNLSDCHAVRLLVTELRTIGKSAQTRQDVDFADSPKLTSTGEGAEIHRTFDRILSSAHACYQKSRIKLRSHSGEPPKDKTKQLGAPKGHPGYIRVVPTNVGKVVTVRRRLKCRNRDHRGHALEPTGRKAEHTIIDLVFSKTGCRKAITKYLGEKARCSKCKKEFLPPAILRLQGRHFGYRFRAWAVYQRVVLRLPYSAITSVLENLFAEQVSKAGIVNFMGQVASEYSSTEKAILDRILASPFIHVDETKLSIKGSQQYVWVLTNGPHVIFQLTETRESTVVQGMLQGYRGVLVSDFYGGYDAIECRQQKCWAHLIRDLNEDLWRNPYLRDFEQLVVSIRDLLVPIFDDVERFGLKARHLQKHRSSVDRFYKRMIDTTVADSELIVKYQKRFQRYRDSLFTFLSDDGIPWNNNAAERAIRHLAIQRKISGSFYQPVAVQYLRLLGIAQTCRFQNKSFLRFLISGEKDVDSYRERRRPKSSRRIAPDSDSNDEACE